MNVKNFFPVPTSMEGSRNKGALLNAGGSFNPNHNLANRRMPLQLPRIRQSVESWRAAVMQAEQAFWPFRVLMQQLFDDTVLNAHVAACMERRLNLTLLRKFEIRDKNGVRLENWTKYFSKRWFRHDFLFHALSARFYGYNLISLGDLKVIDGISYPYNPTIITRWNISPDREQVGQFVYSPTGYTFEKGVASDWHVMVTTTTENGVSGCGYGLLYKVAMLEILVRNNLGWNSNFVELFGQPIRQLKTSKTEGEERDAAEAALDAMGSCAYILTDTMEELILHNGNGTGNGYKAYNDLDARLKADISKMLLGHQDAITAVPGKNGTVVPAGAPTNDDAAGDPVASALRDVQSSDAMFLEPVIEDLLFPKLRKIGVHCGDGETIPEGAQFIFLNDAEERAIQNEKNNVNQKFGTLVMTLAQAGKTVDNEYIEKTLGFEPNTITDMEAPKSGSPDVVKTIPNPKTEPKQAITKEQPLKDKSKERPNNSLLTAKNILNGVV